MSIHSASCGIALYLVVLTGVGLQAQPTFTLNGSAVVMAENCYRLTSPNAPYDVASLWSEEKLDLNYAFDINFAVNLGCNKSHGGGIAFVLHTHPQGIDALGCTGSAMGFARSTERNGQDGVLLAPSLAVEVDAHYDRAHEDLYYPHLSLIQDGNLNKPLTPAVLANTYTRNVLDCEYHTIRVTWTPSVKELVVIFDGEERIRKRINIAHQVFGGLNEVYFGFTASSGSRAVAQMLCVQSVTLTVDEQQEEQLSFENAVGIYPNPLKEKLTIDLQLPEEQYIQMQLYDSSGKLIYEIPPHLVEDNEYFFNLPGLPSGVYYVTITNGTQRVSKKIVHISTIRA